MPPRSVEVMAPVRLRHGAIAAAIGSLLCATLAAPTHAAYLVYTSETAFLTATGAVSTGAIPAATPGVASIALGSVTMLGIGGPTLVAGPVATTWSSLIPGIDVAIHGPESFDLVSSGAVFAMGFQAHEPTTTWFGGPTTDTCGTALCVDTTFTITIKNGATVVGTESINFADDTAAFFGIWSNQAFDRLEVRDSTGNIDDEFFGEVFTSGQPAQIPVPGTAALLALAGFGIALSRTGRRPNPR